MRALQKVTAVAVTYPVWLVLGPLPQYTVYMNAEFAILQQSHNVVVGLVL